MQFRVGGRHAWRAVVVLLVFAFAAQPIVGMAGIAIAATEPNKTPSRVAPAVGTEANSEPPLESPAQPFDAPVTEQATDLANDPHIERGDVRPPKPEPAGAIVDAQTTRHTRTISKGDGSYTQTTSQEASNYLDDQGHWRAIDLDLASAAPGSGFAKQTKANDRPGQPISDIPTWTLWRP